MAGRMSRNVEDFQADAGLLLDIPFLQKLIGRRADNGPTKGPAQIGIGIGQERRLVDADQQRRPGIRALERLIATDVISVTMSVEYGRRDQIAFFQKIQDKIRLQDGSADQRVLSSAPTNHLSVLVERLRNDGADLQV